MPGMFDAPEPHALTLVRRKIALSMAIPEEQIALSVDPHFDFITDTLIMRLRTYLYGEELPAHTVSRSVPVPATWWDHLLHTHGERWWLRPVARRRPPQMTRIRLTATWENIAAYPWAQLRTPTPEYLGAAIRLTMPATTKLTGTGEGDDV